MSAASSLRGSVPATLPHHLRSDCLHAPPPLGSPLAKPPRPLQRHTQPPQPTARNIIHARPAIASTRSQGSCPPMHAAYHRGSATSAASSLRDSVPATPPQLLRCHCLHTLPPLGSPPPQAPPTRYCPARTRHSPQHASSSMHSRRSQAPAHSAAQRTAEVQRRQLRHAPEARCQRRCPIISDPIVCTHCHPSARPSQSPNHRPLQPCALPPQPTAPIIISALPSFASTRSQRSWPPMHAAYH
jgi:hypothetical protein